MISAAPTLTTALAPAVPAAPSAPSGPDAGLPDRNAFSRELLRATGATTGDDRPPAPATAQGPATRARKPDPRGSTQRAPGSDAAGKDAGAGRARMAPASEPVAIASVAAGEEHACVDESPIDPLATVAPAPDLAAFVAGLAARVPPATGARGVHGQQEGAEGPSSPASGAEVPAAANLQAPRVGALREAPIARVHGPGSGSRSRSALSLDSPVAVDDARESSQDAAVPTQRTADTSRTDTAAPASAAATASATAADEAAVTAMAPGAFGGSPAPAVGPPESPSTTPAPGMAAGDRPAAASPVAAMAPGALEDSPAPAVGMREVAPALGARIEAFRHGRSEQARLNGHGAGLGPTDLPRALDAAHLRPDFAAQTLGPVRAADASGGEAAAQAPDMAAASRLASATIDRAAPVTVVEDTLAQAVGTREFAPALGARIAVFARNGVEHAQLNVHPADMGPIVVQLVLDGSQVRVDLASEIGSTRLLLEQSLPVLASALQEAGFTLTGGGVFQQAREGGERGGAGPFPPAVGLRERLADAAADSAAAVTPRVVQRVGLVDLYA